MPHFNKALPAALGLAFLIPSIFSHAQDYSTKTVDKYATMEESRQALRYVENQTTEHDLVVISFDDMALRRTLEPLVAKKMLRIFKDGQLDGIIFLGHRDVPVSKIASIAGSKTFTMPPSQIRVLANIGETRIHRMNVNVSSLFPLEMEENFSRRWPPLKTPKFSLTETHAHRFLGQHSLQIHKTTGEDGVIFSPLTYHIPSKNGGFILHVHARKYNQKSGVGLYATKESKQGFPLNYLFGVYREEGKTLVWEWIHPFYTFRSSNQKKFFKWQIIFMLTPLNKGLNNIQEAFVIKDQTSYIDGMQGYLLTPMVEQRFTEAQ